MFWLSAYGLVERAIRGGAILLPAVRLEQRAILPVGQRHPLAASLSVIAGNFMSAVVSAA